MNAADEDQVTAAADLVGRSGARSFEVGYLHDDVPVEEAGWYAQAQFRGVRLVEEGRSPGEAAQRLAVRILTGARCKCSRLVALSTEGAFAFSAPLMLDGQPWSVQQAAAAGQCRWTLRDARWTPSCTAPPIRVQGSR